MDTPLLIVEDSPPDRKLIEALLGKAGYSFRVTTSGAAALEALDHAPPAKFAAALVDLNLPDMQGLTILEQIKGRCPDLPVIILTGNTDIDTAVQAMLKNAADYIVKPINPKRLERAISAALRLDARKDDISKLADKISGDLSFKDLIGKSAKMQDTVEIAKRGAASNVPLLIEGESGVGKELFARAIQRASPRAKKPFVVVNCGAIPDNLVESILFGHEKGSFTGAIEKRLGKFREADGGTLFLDEIGELKPDIQVKLLRALQDGDIDPVGARIPIKVDIRLISATNQDLLQNVQDGTFREDLYYRLNVFPIRIPALRERFQDIPQLVHHFIGPIARAENKKITGISSDALDLLINFPWPGNIRQLENAVFRAVILASGPELNTDDFPQIRDLSERHHTGPMRYPVHAQQNNLRRAIGTKTGLQVIHPESSAQGVENDSENIVAFDEKGGLKPLSEVEADVIRVALRKYNGQMSEIARRLGIGRSTLYRKVSDLGLDLDETGS